MPHPAATRGRRGSRAGPRAARRAVLRWRSPEEDPVQRAPEAATSVEDAPRREAPRYEPPRYEVIALDCEITAYAPDDRPLF